MAHDTGGHDRCVDQFEKRRRFVVGRGGIALVDDQQDRFLEWSQSLGHLLVQRGDALLPVHDEHQQLGFFDPDLDLPFDFVLQPIGVVQPDSPGVDQLDEPVAGLHHEGDPVTGDPGSRIDHRDSPPCQPVQQGTLADVGPTDDRDSRNGHGAGRKKREGDGGLSSGCQLNCSQ